MATTLTTGRGRTPWKLLALLLGLVLALGLGWAVTHPDALVPSGTRSADKASLPVEGSAAPAFSATSLDGKPVSLASMKGKPVWLSFGASWCQPCRSESPDMEQVWKAHQGQIHMVAAYLEEPEAASAFATSLGLTYTGIADADRSLSANYRAAALPVHFFIDAEGKISTVHVGPISKAQAEDAIKKAAG